MARLTALPSVDIIRGFKGTIDFYIWKGLACARAWPRYRPARQTDASLAAALLFGAIIKAYSLIGSQALEAYQEMALGIPRTPRDVYVSGVYGNLHEAAMSDFLALLTECRDFLSALTAILNALDSVDTDELVVNVDQSVLPPLAATTTGQASALTALHKIDDLQDALESKALDRFLVRGMDQLYSYKSPLVYRLQGAVSGANGYLETAAPAAGTVWKITNIRAVDITSPTTTHDYIKRLGANNYYFHRVTQAFGAFIDSHYHGELWLEPGYTIRVWFAGSLLADTCEINLTGAIMTKET